MMSGTGLTKFQGQKCFFPVAAACAVLIFVTYWVNHSMADTGSLQKVSQVLTVFLRSLAQVPHITGKLRAVAF